MKTLLTIPDLARLLEVSRQNLHQRVQHSSLLPTARTVGGQLLFVADEAVEQFRFLRWAHQKKIPQPGQPGELPVYLTPYELARAAKVSPCAVQDWTKKGYLMPVALSGKRGTWLFTEQDVTRATVLGERTPLSDRMIELVELLAAGHTKASVARSMKISPQNIATMFRRLTEARA